MQPIVLASTSPYRKALLEKLCIPFTTASPSTDETPLAGEQSQALAERLSLLKADSLRSQFADALIIGSDQVVAFEGENLGKPGSFENAFAQLRRFSGKQVDFYTGLTVLDARSNKSQTIIEPFSVQFRVLSDEQISRYLNTEKPYDCAGSFKCEGLGICLFERMIGDDPNTLIGLPLIRLTTLLGNTGIQLPIA
ncbi:Maf family protein [Pokkaliibacter sp. CJK22405]|uniref:Maf family protein n=1 Tax=Pokkaliibacter sp. CJK22405 TaxID=3384615 RepID=UPI003984ED80